MTKIRSYYLTNIKSELLYFDKELTYEKLKEVANNLVIRIIMTLESNEEELFDSFITNNSNIYSIISLKDILILENIIDFTLPIFNTNDNELYDKEKDQNNNILDLSN